MKMFISLNCFPYISTLNKICIKIPAQKKRFFTSRALEIALSKASISPKKLCMKGLSAMAFSFGADMASYNR